MGTVEYSDFPEAARRLPRVGDAFQLDRERILSLQPDMLLAWDGGTPVMVIERLRSDGFPVEVIGGATLDSIARALERIGDQAVNIAERVDAISRDVQLDHFFDYSSMGEKAREMLKMSLDALVNMDYDLAFNVVMMDDEVDHIKSEAYDRIKQAMSKHPDKIGYLINLLLISRHLERLADHATNIAEEVIYLIEGEIVRHAAYNRE